MRPRIEAERRLGFYEAVLAGAGSAKKGLAEKWVKEQRAIAAIDGGGFKPKTPADWAKLGMRVHVEPKGKEG
jgi:hypothetical protein